VCARLRICQRSLVSHVTASPGPCVETHADQRRHPHGCGAECASEAPWIHSLLIGHSDHGPPGHQWHHRSQAWG
jgi:hypothetical protein